MPADPMEFTFWRQTSAQRLAETPAAAALRWDSTLKAFVMGDGLTAGGVLLPRADGLIPFTGPVKLANGSLAAPALAFADDADSGLYRIGANNLGLVVGGALALDLSADGVLFPTRPALLAYASSVKSGVTGDGTYYNIPFDTEVYDVGGCFNPATGVYTAKRTGPHRFGWSVSYQTLGTTSRVEVNGVASNRSPYFVYATPAGVSGFVTRNGYAEVDMDAGDTFVLRAYAAGAGGKTVDIYGAASTTLWTWLAGGPI